MTQSLEAAARAAVRWLRAQASNSGETTGATWGHIHNLEAALDDTPADAHPNKARQLAEAWLLACEQAQDPTVVGSTCALIRAESALLEFIDPSPDRTQDAREFLPEGITSTCDECGHRQLVIAAEMVPKVAATYADAAHVAAQADALAALARLVELYYGTAPNGRPHWLTDAWKDEVPEAWAEARRVIAATGEKG